MYVLGRCETPSFTPIQYNRQDCKYNLTFRCVGLLHSEYVEATSCGSGQGTLHLPSSYRSVTGPYTAPDESNPTSLEYTLILSFHIRRGPTQARYFNLDYFVSASSPIHAMQPFSNCGPRTTSGPRVLPLWCF